LTERQFLDLLGRPEGETPDFKATDYDLKNTEKRVELIKDVLAMANTPREEEESYLVLGIKRNRDGSTEHWGLRHFEDDADLQSQVSERVTPVPKFVYHTLASFGKQFGVIAIARDLTGPFTLSKHLGSMGTGQVYFRRGSKNDVATGDDLRRITDWFKSQGRKQARILRRTETWAPFLTGVSNFEPHRRYILIASPIREDVPGRVESLALIPWTAVFDFDPRSESGGLLDRVKDAISSQRSLHLAVKGDATAPGARSTTWFFARGLQGRQETLQEDPYREWFRAYAGELERQFSRLAASVSPMPVTIVVLWYDAPLSEHLRRILEVALTQLNEIASAVVATVHTDALQPIVDPLGVPLIEISLRDLCAGIAAHYEGISAGSKSLRFPGATDAGTLIDQDKARWLQEDLDLADVGAGQSPPTDVDPSREFLIGGEVGCNALALHADVDRDATRRIEDEVERELEEKRTLRVNIYHAPGAGGTMVGKRVIWDLHKRYPSAVLVRCVPGDTANRLYFLTSETALPLLIMVDDARVAERQIDDLFTELRARHVPVVLLQVLRRFSPPASTRHYLPTELSRNETAQFFHAFAHAEPSHRPQLERLANSASAKERSPFVFGLTTYGRDFRGLESNVRQRIEVASNVLRHVAVFMAISHRYAQRELPGQVFAEMLGIPRNRVVDVQQLLPAELQELFIEGQDGMWRTAHELIAREILEQVLAGAGVERQWDQNLSQWAKDFAQLCRGDEDSVPSDEMLEVARRTFIYRDNADLLGDESSATHRFAQLIEDIPIKEGRLEVLKTVITLFPNEAHFWAHIGRFYALSTKDYEEALRCNDRAVALQGNDHVLHHMLAMTLRQFLYDKMAESTPITGILDDVKRASNYFEDARALNPEDEHNYISEVQMIVRVLDYASRDTQDGLAGYLQTQPDAFLRAAVDRCETLLEAVRRTREGENPSGYEQDCRARLDQLYGQYRRGLQTWDSLLQRRDVYAPPVRRQIVWTYLRRAKSWEAMPLREIDRTTGLLEDNLDADPNNERDLCLWIQAVRRGSHPPSVDEVIERVAYWKANSGSLDATYYLYVLNALKTLDGSVFAREDTLRYIDESRQLARSRRNRTRSFEWLGTAEFPLARLVSHVSLGEWDEQTKVNGGLSAFFVPAVGNFTELNLSIDCFLGFSYDGIRAWEVKPASGGAPALGSGGLR
jgi:tetratricopeptide (TPR) repeat protein